MDQPPTNAKEQPQAVAAGRRRFKKRITIPGFLLAFLSAMIVWAVILGNWADTSAKNPASSSEGIVAQLYQQPDGTKHVRCAVVLDYPVEEVWAVVTDYEHFSEIFPQVRFTQIDRDAEELYHLRGTATAGLFGEWPFEAVIRHDESPDKRAASWDNPSQHLQSNRGSWTLTPLGANRTLVAYSLQVEVRRYPAFLIRDVFLFRLPGVVANVADEVKKRHGRAS